MDTRLARVTGGKYWQDTVTGRIFVSRRAAIEYFKRQAFGDWTTKAQVTDSHRVRALSSRKLGLSDVPSDGVLVGTFGYDAADPRNAASVVSKPKAKSPKSSGAGSRVRLVNGVWRRYLVQVDGSQRFVADYRTMQDALDCRSPIADHSDVDRSYVVNQRIEG